LVVLYVARFQTSLVKSLPTIIGICTLVLVTLAVGFFLSPPPWNAACIPLTLTAMVLTLVYNPQFALLMSLAQAVAMTVLLQDNLGDFLVQMAGLGVAVLLLRGVRTRTQLVKVAIMAGLTYAFMTLATGLLYEQTWSLIAADSM